MATFGERGRELRVDENVEERDRPTECRRRHDTDEGRRRVPQQPRVWNLSQFVMYVTLIILRGGHPNLKLLNRTPNEKQCQLIKEFNHDTPINYRN